MAATLATLARQQIAAEKRAARIDAAIARRQQEINELVAEHRLVRVTYPNHQQDDQPMIPCVANRDMPEYGIVAGQQFTLVASSYPGYYYIVTESADGRVCTCKGHQYRHSCEHAKEVNAFAVARYLAHKAGNDLVLEPVAVIAADDQDEHVADDLRTGKFPTRKDLAAMTLSSNRGFSFMA